MFLVFLSYLLVVFYSFRVSVIDYRFERGVVVCVRLIGGFDGVVENVVGGDACPPGFIGVYGVARIKSPWDGFVVSEDLGSSSKLVYPVPLILYRVPRNLFATTSILLILLSVLIWMPQSSFVELFFSVTGLPILLFIMYFSPRNIYGLEKVVVYEAMYIGGLVSSTLVEALSERGSLHILRR